MEEKDLADLIVITPIEQTPRQREIADVARNAREIALQKLQNATTLPDYLQWHRAATLFFSPEGIAWNWDYGGTSAEELVEEQMGERRRLKYQNDASTAGILKKTLDQIPSQPGKLRLALKRVRDIGDRYSYRVLAAFPNDRNVRDALDEDRKELATEDIIFLEPENACVAHPCDDLFKIHRNKPFYLDSLTLAEALRKLEINKQGFAEYLLGQAGDQKITQDPTVYILVALMGGYSNERFRVRVSDFWNKNPSSTKTGPDKL